LTPDRQSHFIANTFIGKDHSGLNGVDAVYGQDDITNRQGSSHTEINPGHLTGGAPFGA
jgi:hypothetical protein